MMAHTAVMITQRDVAARVACAMAGDVRQNRVSLTPVSSAKIANDGAAYRAGGLVQAQATKAATANQRHRRSVRFGPRVNSQTVQKKTKTIPSGAISTVSEKSRPWKCKSQGRRSRR